MIVLRNTIILIIAGSLVALPCSDGSVTGVAKGCLASRCDVNLFTQILGRCNYDIDLPCSAFPLPEVI